MEKEIEEAINYLKEDLELYEDFCYLTTEEHMKALKIILDYISKTQKENEKLKEIFKNALNNIGFEVENNWRKFEKLENEEFINE